MADDFGGYGGLAKGIGGFIGGLMDSSAQKEQAQSYEEASAIAKENARLEEEATGIKLYQEERKINESMGATRAAQAASGFGESGSATYLLRESALQGGIAEAGIGIQGQIQENVFLEQSAKAAGEAQAAKAASTKSAAGGIFSLITGIASIL